MIVSNAMVKAADHMKGHVMSPIGVSALLCMIGEEKKVSVHDRLGAGQCYMILLGEECMYMIG